jgi:hypothetical protein
MKKWFYSISVSLLSMMAFVSAYAYADFRGASNDIIQWISDIFGPFFSVLLGVSQFDSHLFARVLLLVLMYVIIFVVLRRMDLFKKNKAITIVISLIVALLGARYISEINLIEGIMLPYGVVTIAITVFLPFFIFAFLIIRSDMGHLGRRLSWILFGVAFLGLWLTRYDELAAEGNGVANWIYMLGAIAVLIAILFDRRLQEYLGVWQAERERRQMFSDQIGLIDQEIARAASSGAMTRESEQRLEHLHEARERLVRERAQS